MLLSILNLSLRGVERRSNLHQPKSRLPRFARNDNILSCSLITDITFENPYTHWAVDIGRAPPQSEALQEEKMDARKIVFDSIREATAAIESLGSGNSRLMASRAIHINVLIRKVPGPEARFLKTVYNDIGAEAAISHQAYFEENGAVTDMIVMGTIYQHREVRRILTDNPKIRPWLEEIGTVVENSPENTE
jgi:hypothetical protein